MHNRGLGQLSVENGTRTDGVVILTTSDDRAVMAAYLRAEESFAMTGIREGIYYLYFSTGSAWNGDESKFAEDVQYQVIAVLSGIEIGLRHNAALRGYS